MDLNSPESKRKDLLEKELNELIDIKHIVEGELFQKYFATPIYKEDKLLKDSYDCKSYDEFLEMRGKHWGLKRFFRCVDEIETRMKFIRSDLGKL
jgi:hypothetical protein